MKIFKLDKYTKFLEKYGERKNSLADYLIAETAWSKSLPLLTSNLKHFKQIKEIKLRPMYE